MVIAPGAFTQNKKGVYAFQGNINAASLSLSISPAGSKAYAFMANGTGADLAGLANPVTVALTIGNERGSTQDSARIGEVLDLKFGGGALPDACRRTSFITSARS